MHRSEHTLVTFGTISEVGAVVHVEHSTLAYIGDRSLPMLAICSHQNWRLAYIGDSSSPIFGNPQSPTTATQCAILDVDYSVIVKGLP
ncbi:hypothetical protein Y032_0514g2775 [Ancylostoma ceylanicum]|uniref:Uncharacterized protein n=1 Tax=Ancylostoma ceylanicum TaxID=53326 RepID=A0A016WV14_9BILA|nr:hypothetical protein Y032_0514g2775 [Ancylostoma ceylanicum]